MVFVPIIFPGSFISTRNNRAARENSASAEIPIPGASTPPMYSPRAETTVVERHLHAAEYVLVGLGDGHGLLPVHGADLRTGSLHPRFDLLGPVARHGVSAD